ncbi:MAG: hypothetical protein IPN17_10865 [Deltaproteobacteria bacterium]|nr:hypothetical protein [Deltaproteobacteria bacterium]
MDRRMMMTAAGNTTPWRTTVEERDSGGNWHAVPDPGHEAEQACLHQMRAELDGRLSRLDVFTQTSI